MSQTATSSNAVGVAKGSSTAMAGGSNGGAKDLLIALHELVEMESDTNLDISIYKRKTRQLVQKLLSKMEQTVSRQRQLESELRIKNEQVSSVYCPLSVLRSNVLSMVTIDSAHAARPRILSRSIFSRA